MEKKEIQSLVTHVKNIYPFYYYLNSKTEISNVYLYKLLTAIDELLESKNKL